MSNTGEYSLEDMLYPMEDLYPILRDLGKKFTGHDSTSISYDDMQQLMGAVIYTINETNPEEETLRQELTAAEAYALGQKEIKRKKETVDTICKSITEKGCYHYGIQCVRDTLNSIINYNKYFDWDAIRFEPQRPVDFLTYPVRGDNPQLTGIDAVYHYLICFTAEQEILQHHKRSEIVEKLTKYAEEHGDLGEIDGEYVKLPYQELDFNILDVCGL